MRDVFELMGRHRAEVITSLLQNPIHRRVLDVGAGDLSRLYRPREDILTLDSSEGPEIDIIGVVENLPFKSEVFDLIIATELIEHVRYPLKMLIEIKRALKKGGHLIISTPNPCHLESRLAMLLLGFFLPDRDDHAENDVGHIHFIDPAFLRELLDKSGFRVTRDLSNVLHLGGRVWAHVPRAIPRSLCSQILYLARKEDENVSSA